ncbi:MAG: efflux RND transporter periplasmic adaptor subunit [Planctomycetes bacterium]|nr:efflux RND transporter periplasmic adaptor subunit [Planctomycetota bacterium]
MGNKTSVFWPFLIVIVVVLLLSAGGLVLRRARARAQEAERQNSVSQAKLNLCALHGFPEAECYACHPELAGKFRAAKDWCGEHNVPESQCEICDPNVKFKARGDWCKLHGYPQSQCSQCNPALAAAARPRFFDWCQEHQIAESQCTLCQPHLEVTTEPDWCEEHGVPDSQCVRCHPDLLAKSAETSSTTPETEDSSAHAEAKEGDCKHGFPAEDCFRCHPELEARFQKSGDWCGGHKVPESQCFECNPGLRKGNAPGPEVETPAAEGGAGLPPSDPDLPASAYCTTHYRRVRLSSPEVAGQIGLTFERVRRQAFTEGLTVNAEVQFNASAVARLSSRFRGTVQEVVPSVGEVLSAGDALVTLESQELGEAKMEFFKAQRELEVIEASNERLTRLAEAVRNLLETLRPGVSPEDLRKAWQPLDAGEARTRLTESLGRIERARADLALAERLYPVTTALAQANRAMLALLREAKMTAREATEKMRELEIGDAKAALLEKLATVELARSEFERQVKLRADQVGIDRDYLAARKELDLASSSYGALLEQTSLSTEKAQIEAEAQMVRTRQELALAEAEFATLGQEIRTDNDLRLSQAAREIQLARQAADMARGRLGLLGLTSGEIQALPGDPPEALCQYHLRAPFSGTLIERPAVRGEVVEPGQALAVVADLSTMWLQLDVFPADLPRLETGQPVRFRVEGLEGHAFEGRIVWLGAQVNDRTRVLNVRAEVDNSSGLLRANLFGRATVVLSDEEAALTIPKEAIQSDGCCSIVFLRIRDDLYAPRKVRVGYEGVDFYEIEVGLSGNEEIVTRGSFLLKTELLKENIGAGCVD